MSIRHKCFLSYHKADSREVDAFIDAFDHWHNVFTYRAVREMDDNIVNSGNHDYVMRRIRELYLTDSTVTIVLLGRCTWARRYIDWEIESSLRNDFNNKRSGLMAISLPSISHFPDRTMLLPPRFKDNWDVGHNGVDGYAKWYVYPDSPQSLESMIEDAYQARTTRTHLIDNNRQYYTYNRLC